ncbi:MAG: DUF559 domain-containing protein [bacterium]|nr:DUF559 domain-containing protein [bacterium]
MQVIPTRLLSLTRNLRENQTTWEKKLWQHLRTKRFYGIQFKRQVRLGNYITNINSVLGMIRDEVLFLTPPGLRPSSPRQERKQ